VALYRSSQAAAVLEGRSFVLPDDVKRLAVPVLAHRLVVDLDRSLRGVSTTSVLAAVLDSVPAPPLAGD
jgi:MoxR-like ATPase